MSRGPHLFRENDIIKALRAAEKAGVRVGRYEIDLKTGKLVIVAVGAQMPDAIESAVNEWGTVK